MTTTHSRRGARSSMGSRTARRANTKRGATAVVAGRRIKTTKPRPRSKMKRLMRGERT